MGLVESIDAVVQGVGPWGYPLLALSAMVEYVFPLFPGDTVTLLGGVYAARGEKPWALVLLAVTLGSVLGASFDYLLGKRLAARVDLAVDDPRKPLLRGLRREQFHKLQGQMRRRGTWLLLVNRFLPGIRPFLFVAAGAAGLPLPRVLLLGTVSALAWNGGILALGLALGGNVERVLWVMSRYERFAWTVLLGAGLLLALRWAWRARRPSRGPAS